jgi:hypothetical protein
MKSLQVVRHFIMGVVDLRGTVQGRGLVGNHLGRWLQLTAAADSRNVSRRFPAAHQTVLESEAEEPTLVQTHSHAPGDRRGRVARHQGRFLLQNAGHLERGDPQPPEEDADRGLAHSQTGARPGREEKTRAEAR